MEPEDRFAPLPIDVFEVNNKGGVVERRHGIGWGGCLKTYCIQQGFQRKDS